MPHLSDLHQELHSRCAQENIQYPGRIQSHGALLAGEMKNFRITHYSENLNQFLPDLPAEILGCGLDQIFPSLGKEQFKPDQHQTLIHSRASGESDLVISCHCRNDRWYVQLEKKPLDSSPEAEIHLNAHHVMTLCSQTGLRDLQEKAVDIFRELLGYHRVMLYRFAENWDGEVVAESTADQRNEFLGLHFPATDIPPQARDLYHREAYRMLVDAEAEPVIIRQAEFAPALEMTNCVLRAISPIHCEYLGHMGVRASFILGLKINQKLWGLIACHHPNPFLIDVSKRQKAEALGAVLAAQIKSIELTEKITLRNQARKQLVQLSLEIRGDTDAETAFRLHGKRLLGAVKATGIALLGDNLQETSGSTPPEKILAGLYHWLGRLPGPSSTQAWTEPPLDRASPKNWPQDFPGILAVPMNTSGETFWLVFFRREWVQTITWAGNPQATVSIDDENKLHPRNSFRQWREKRRGKAQPWSEGQIRYAEQAAQLLLNAQLASDRLVARQQARQAQEESARLALITRHIRSTVIITGPDRCIQWVNPAFERDSGYSLAECIGRNPRFLQGKNTDPATVAAIGSALAGEKPFTGEILNYNKSGKPYWIGLEIVPCYDDRKVLLGYVGLQTDITFRKRQEEERQQWIAELKQQNDFLRIAGDLARLGHWEIFADQRPPVWSDTTYHIFGYPVGHQVTFEDGYHLHHPEDRSALDGILKNTFATGEPFVFESRIVRPDGRLVWIRAQGIAVSDQDGRVTSIRGAVQDISDYKKIEESLRHREESLRTILEAIPSAIFLKDAEGRLLYVNAVGKQLTNWDTIQWVGLTEQEIARSLPAYRPIAEASIRSDQVAWQEGKRIFLEEAFLMEEGKEAFFETIKVPLFQDDGSRRGLVAVVSEVTAQRQATQAIDRERALFAAGPVAVMIWRNEPGWPVAYVSKNIKNLLGYRPEELTNERFHYNDIIHPDDREAIVQDVQEKLEQRTPLYEQSYRLLHRDGTYRWFFDVTRPEYTPDGTCSMIRGYLLDQTPLREAVSALQQRDDAFARMVKHVPGMLFSYSQQSEDLRTFSFISQGVYNLFGFSDRDEINQESLLAKIHPEDLPGLEKILKEEKHLTQWTHEMRFHHPEKGERWLHVTSSRDSTESETPVWYGYCFDITERKVTEARVLHESKREAIERLAGGIAHDFNNYLNVLGVSAEMLRNMPNLPDKAERMAKNIGRGVDSAAAVARQLLAFSKEQPIHLEPIKLDTFIRECVTFATRGTPVQSFYDNDDPNLTVQADPNLLQQAIFNLVINACEAMDNRGQVMIQIRSEPHRGKVIVRVADTGPGIPQAVRDLIFEPYYSSKATGSGLGLFVVQSILRRLGGEVKLDQSVQQGATFVLELPLEIDDPKDRPLPDQPQDHLPVDATVQPETDPRTFHLLVLEDDPEQRLALEQFFATLEVSADFFEDGDILLKKAPEYQNHGVRLIALLDITLPGVLGGLDIIVELRQKLPQARLFLMSGYSSEWVENEGRVAGLEVGFIAKPYRLRELRKRLFAENQ